MYSELLTEYRGLPVVDFNTADDWQGPGVAYRLGEEWDDDLKVADRLASLLEQTGSDQVTTLLIGAWSGSGEGDDSAEVVSTLSQAAPKLPALKALFFGEMTYEQCEISWINQSDVSPLLSAYPQLESLRIRGGNGLSFSRVRHESLRELAIESGGLGRSTIRELFLCDFPALEYLELQLGEANYGFDGGVEDLQPVLSGALFPRLKFLGLMNAPIADEIAAVVVNSPVVDRIQYLDLSMGNLGDAGARSLLGLAGKKNLKLLNFSHHYVTPELVAELEKALPCEVIADEHQDPDDDWRPVLHAE